MAVVAKNVCVTMIDLGPVLEGKHEPQVVLMSQFSRFLLNRLPVHKCTIPLSAGKVLLSGLAPVLEMNWRYSYSAENEDLVATSIFCWFV